MKRTNNMLSRREFVAGTAGAAAIAAAPGIISSASAATPFKIATVFALSGPASLFGPTQTACAKLAVSEINAKGGILGGQVEVVPLDGGAPPADAAKAVLRAVLRDKVQLVLGSHNSAVREAIVATLKGRVPYVYTPVYEGGECNPNVYVFADTPTQQVAPSIKALAGKGAKSWYLIGNDYVWGRKTQDAVKKYVAETGGKIVGEEYVPLGAPNKFEDAVARIKAKAPDAVSITLVGGDNVNFNRTFAGFGLDKSMKRVSYLLEELTLQGIGAKNSAGLFSCMSYFASIDTPANNAFKANYKKMFGDKAPPLSLIGTDCYSGTYLAKALVEKAGGTDRAKLMAASQDLKFHTAAGPATMTNRHVVKDMFLAECKGTNFDIIETFKSVPHGQACG